MMTDSMVSSSAPSMIHHATAGQNIQLYRVRIDGAIVAETVAATAAAISIGVPRNKNFGEQMGL